MRVDTIEPTISVFIDEVTPDPSAQIEALRDFQLDHIDLRSAWNTDISELDRERVDMLSRLFAAAGVRVACLATRIGKRTSLREIESIEAALARAFDAAELFDVKSVRIFGFRTTPEEAADPTTLRRATECLARLAARAAGRGVTLMIECERGMVIDGPEMALKALRAVDSPALRFIWDAGNMVDLGIDRPTDRWFDRLVPYVGQVHVKDGTLGSTKTCFAGAGDGQIGELVARLCARSYDGVFTLEPNVPRLAEFNGNRRDAVAGALQAFRALVAASLQLESAT